MHDGELLTLTLTLTPSPTPTLILTLALTFLSRKVVEILLPLVRIAVIFRHLLARLDRGFDRGFLALDSFPLSFLPLQTNILGTKLGRVVWVWGVSDERWEKVSPPPLCRKLRALPATFAPPLAPQGHPQTETLARTHHFEQHGLALTHPTRFGRHANAPITVLVDAHTPLEHAHL